jgi:hypothetical protein
MYLYGTGVRGPAGNGPAAGGGDRGAAVEVRAKFFSFLRAFFLFALSAPLPLLWRCANVYTEN